MKIINCWQLVTSLSLLSYRDKFSKKKLINAPCLVERKTRNICVYD